MISLDAALAALAGDLKPLSAETIPYHQADGRVLAAAITAAMTQPPFPASAMDGYAVRASDLGEAPARLRLAGESAAGHAFSGALKPGEAALISTGAPVPAGADQVVVKEVSRVDGDHVTLDARPEPGKHIRPAGVDFRSGQTLLPAGTRLRADHVALAAGCGALDLTVTRRPRVGVLSTGDELVEPGEPVSGAQIINSVSKGMAPLIRRWGGEPVYLGTARDDPQSVRAAFAKGRGLHLIVTLGGASVGAHDHLRAVFAADGGTLNFEKIAIKPGKPTWFGRLDGQPFLGLPGNPVSALVMAHLTLRPALAALLGADDASLALEDAVLAAPLPETGPRETWVRARLTDGRAEPHPNQDSSALSAMAQSNCLIRRMAGGGPARAEESTIILRL